MNTNTISQVNESMKTTNSSDHITQMSLGDINLKTRVVYFSSINQSLADAPVTLSRYDCKYISQGSPSINSKDGWIAIERRK